MPLGLARDSMLDLTELVSSSAQEHRKNEFDFFKNNNDQHHPSQSSQPQHEVWLQNPALAIDMTHAPSLQQQGDILQIPVKNDHNAIMIVPHDPLVDDYLDNASHNNDNHNNNNNNTAPYSGFTMDYYEEEDYYMEDPYAPSYEEFGRRRATTSQKTSAFCCFFAPWNTTAPQQPSTTPNSKEDTPSPPLIPEPTSGSVVTTTLSSKEQIPTILPKQAGGSTTISPPREETKEHVPSPPQSPTHSHNKEDEDVKEEEKRNKDDGEEEDEDNVSTGSDLYGEKLSDNDRLAVLARLRLTDQESDETPQRLFVSTSSSTTSLSSSSSVTKKKLPVTIIAVTPANHTISTPSTVTATATSTTTTSTSPPKTMEMEHNEEAATTTTTTTDNTPIEEEEEKEKAPPPAPLKGILKRSSQKSMDTLTNPASSSFGSLDSKSVKDEATTAAAAAAASRRKFFPSVDEDRYPSSSQTLSSDSPKQKKKILFAPMARVIAVASRKDMLFIEKSQVWWQKSDYNDFKKTGRIIAKAMMEGGSEIWLTSTNAWGRRLSGRRKTSLSSDRWPAAKENNANKSAVSSSHKNDTDASSSSEEGEEDDTNFGNKWWCKFGHSRRGLEHIASIEEGRERQRNVNASIAAVVKEQVRQRMSGIKDEYKLSTSGRTYTSWARDLALAAGAADAEAVRANFDTNAKNRAHYLQQRSRGNNNNNSISMNNHFPTFFMDMSVPANVLDANTHSTMRLKKKQQQKQEDKPVPIHNDPDPTGGSSITTKRISKKAAGFGHGEGSVDMAAVLTGMGPTSRTRVEAQ